MKHRSLDTLEAAAQHRFANRALLEQALTHSSFASESGGEAADNETLEFLGDAVLQLVVTQELYQRFPSYREGELSKLRAHLVNARQLSQCAGRLGLGDYLRLGRGEEKSGGRRKPALLSDAVEALLAALYLDGGLQTARQFVLARILEPELDTVADRPSVALAADHKSRLQELLRASGRPEPRYEVMSEEGPAHRRRFTMQVTVFDAANQIDFSSEGAGGSKKTASQRAAQRALERLQSEHDRQGAGGETDGGW